VLIGRELIKNEFDVSFVTFDYDNSAPEEMGGFKLFKTVPRGYRFYDAKSLFYGLRNIWSALKKADADIYIQRCGSSLTGLVAFFCVVERKKFVYHLANDNDVDISFFFKKGILEALLYSFGLLSANAVISQSEYQSNLIKHNFKKKSVLIKNSYILEDTITTKQIPPVVLWVGAIKPEWKQPELFIKLASELPNVNFQMIGGPSGNVEFYNNLKKIAENLPNMHFKGFVPFSDINNYFNRASVFVNTSTVEGFPNTFLQSWAHYIPVVSLNVDPDEIICDFELGFHSKSFEKLVLDVANLVKNNILREKMGANGRRYVEMNHNINSNIELYVKLFNDLIKVQK